VIRGFSTSGEVPRPNRTVDDDAPRSLRNELLDLAFHLAGQMGVDERAIYDIIELAIGVTPSGEPYGSFRRSASRDLGRVEWMRVYDLMIRLAHVFRGANRFDQYRAEVNQILAANGIVWDLDQDANLVRILPPDAANTIQDMMGDLAEPRYEAARFLFNQAKDAYDARPRRDRDACANAFDALESVAKTLLAMPMATFGNVVAELRRRGIFTPEIVESLSKLNDTRNRHFGHGMTAPFTLKASEVDFVFLTCIAGIVLLVRELG